MRDHFETGRYIYVRPSERERITVETDEQSEWTLLRQAATSGGPLLVEIHYEDFAGQRRRTLEIELRKHAQEVNSWVVSQARHRDRTD